MKKIIKKWLGIGEDIRSSITENAIFGSLGIRLDRIENMQLEILLAIRDIKENECENSGLNWIDKINNNLTQSK